MAPSRPPAIGDACAPGHGRRWRPGADEGEHRSTVLEVHEDPPEVLTVLLHPVVPSFDVLSIQEPQDPLLQLARTLTGNDLHSLGPGPLGLIDDLLQGTIDLLALVVDVMKVEFQRHRCRSEDSR